MLYAGNVLYNSGATLWLDGITILIKFYHLLDMYFQKEESESTRP